jgi:hypothetical protein
VTECVRGTCGTACGCVGDPFLWHGPVSHRPPAMLDGLPPPTFLQSPRSASKRASRRNGKTVGSSPLLSAGFRISQPPGVRRHLLVAILCWGVEARAAREENPKTEEMGAAGLLQRGISDDRVDAAVI